MNKLKKLATILGIIISLSIVISIMTKVDGRYAKAKETKQYIQRVEQRLDIKILEDRANALRERIWSLEDRYNNINEMPQEIKDEYRRLKEEREKILNEINKMTPKDNE